MTATDACAIHLAKIDELLTMLSELSGACFNVPAESADWGHVGSLDRISMQLREALAMSKELAE